MSTLRLTTISNQTGSASVPSDTVINGSAKAWVNFNGTGTVAIRASFNVSSITDNGSGDYTVNFTTAMPDANYSIAGNAGYGAGGSGRYLSAPDSTATLMTTTQLRFQTVYAYNSPQDCQFVTLAIFR